MIFRKLGKPKSDRNTVNQTREEGQICATLLVRLCDFSSFDFTHRFQKVTHVTSYTCYKLHMLQVTYVTSYTCYKLHMLQVTHVTRYICYKLHMLQVTHVTSYICYKLHMLQATYVTSYTCYKLHILQVTHVTSYTCYNVISIFKKQIVERILQCFI